MTDKERAQLVQLLNRNPSLSELIHFRMWINEAKDAGRKTGLEEAAQIAEKHLTNTSLLTSQPPKSGAAWDIRNEINELISLGGSSRQ